MHKKLLFVLVAALVAAGASAQNTDIEALSGLPFNFGNPGSRALGMGGAFLGLADDASAAEANPAGLTILIRPEFTLELNNSKTTQTLQVSGEYPGSVVSEGFTTNSTSAGVAFASFVIPRGNFRLAGYYQSVLDFRNDANALFKQDNFGGITVNGINFYVGPSGPVTLDQCVQLGADCTAYRTFPYFTAVDITLRTWGLATAYKIGDNFSIGAALKYQQFKESALSFRTDFNLQPLVVLAQQSNQTDYSYSVGFKYGGPRSKFSLGGVYKTGGSFVAPVSVGTFDANFNTSLEEVGRPHFNVPDSYGLGISYHPVDPLRINIDAVKVKYSQLADKEFVSVYDDLAQNPQYKRDDVTEYHIGAEWFFVNSAFPWAIRAGYWRDPDHSLVWAGPQTTGNEVAASILFAPGKDQTHYSAGIGAVFGKLQVDAAYDTSDVQKVGSLTAKYVF